MADRILEDSAGFGQSQQRMHYLEFNPQQWHDFMYLLIIGSTMCEILSTLELEGVVHDCIALCVEKIIQRWTKASKSLIDVLGVQNAD